VRHRIFRFPRPRRRHGRLDPREIFAREVDRQCPYRVADLPTPPRSDEGDHVSPSGEHPRNGELRDTGIQGLSQVQVARRAKVRCDCLTYYFPKRCDLLEAVAVRFVDGVVRGLEELAARYPADPRATLERVAQALTDRGHMRMFTGVIAEADSDPAVRSVLVRETARIQSMLAELLGGGGGGDDAKERAALALASLWGLGLYDFVVRGKQAAAIKPAILACLEPTHRSRR
jgi:hypothetical protein